MKALSELIDERYKSYVNSDNKKSNLINVTNDNNEDIEITEKINDSSKNEYALNRSKFTPNTEEAQLAEKIATALHDLDNYACFLNVVNQIGVYEAERLFRVALSNIEEKQTTGTPVRKPAAYFMWIFRNNMY